MKNILLLSDTHSYIDDRILQYAHDADEVWHGGDIGDVKVYDQLAQIKPIRAVYGNIDNTVIRQLCPENLHFTLEGVTVFITHIGGYPGRYTARVRAELLDKKPKLYICGHSHILKVMFDKELEILHMNPGACGYHGIHQVRTMLRFQLNDGKIEKLEVIELGSRSRHEER